MPGRLESPVSRNSVAEAYVSTWRLGGLQEARQGPPDRRIVVNDRHERWRHEWPPCWSKK